MFSAIRKLASKFFAGITKEADTLEELHGDVQAARERMEARDPGLKALLENAHGYAVFPSIGKATAVLGGAFGKGEVFEQGTMVGYAGVGQLTLGVQVGGQTFSEIIAFQDKSALDRFKAGRWAFAANASAVLVKAGAASTSNYQRGVAVFVSSEGGMMLEAAIGAQKFFFRPAALGRVVKPETVTKTKATRGGGVGTGGGGKSSPRKTNVKPKKPQRRPRPGAKARGGTAKRRPPAKRTSRTRTGR